MTYSQRLNIERVKTITDKQNHMDWDANAHYKDSRVADQYDAVRFSSLAGRFFNNWEQATIRRAFERGPSGAHIANIPCGTGKLAQSLLRAGNRVHGKDISAEMLEAAKKRLASFGGNFRSEVADAKQLDQTHEQHDTVLFARVLMHFLFRHTDRFSMQSCETDLRYNRYQSFFSSRYQRFRRWIKRMPGHQAPALFPVASKEVDCLLAKSGHREIRRQRLNSLVSEATYIVSQPFQG